MVSLKSAIADSNLFQIVSTLIVVSLIIIAEVVLISENAAFLETQGKSTATALALATCVALLIPVVPGLLVEDQRKWVLMGKWIFVVSLITMQVYFASQTAIAPQLKKMASSSELALINDYKSQLDQYDKQINVYQEHIDSFPEKFRTKRAQLSSFQLKLIEDRRKVLADLRAISQKTTAEPASLTGLLQHLTIVVTILYRLVLEIGVVILTCSLRVQFAPQQPQEAAPLTEPETVPKIHPAPISNMEKATLSSKKFVRSIYPESFCRSKNGSKGPYVVYSNRQTDTEIAKAKSSKGAWNVAAQKLRVGSVFKSHNERRVKTAAKVYAIKS